MAVRVAVRRFPDDAGGAATGCSDRILSVLRTEHHGLGAQRLHTGRADRRRFLETHGDGGSVGRCDGARRLFVGRLDAQGAPVGPSKNVVKALFVAALCLASRLLAGNSLVDEGYEPLLQPGIRRGAGRFRPGHRAETRAIPDLHNHAAETIVFREMFRDGALESELVTGNNSLLRRAKLNPTSETQQAVPERDPESPGSGAGAAAPKSQRHGRALCDGHHLRTAGELLLPGPEGLGGRPARLHHGAQAAQPGERAGSGECGCPPGAGLARLRGRQPARRSTGCSDS